MTNYILLALSLLSFMAGCMYAIKMKLITRSRILLISIISTILLYYSAFFLVSDYFTNNGIDDSVFYHLEYGLAGSGFKEYWLLITLTTIFAIISVLIPYRLLNKITAGYTGPASNISNKHPHLWVIYFCLLSSFLISPTTYGILKHSNSSYSNLFSSVTARDDFYEYYRSPTAKKEDNKSYNLVYIYAESLERTYFDESVFPGLIKFLREYEGTGISFTDIRQVRGTGWTIAGMTASQCGIPLVTPSHDNSMSAMDSFLANAYCLGDMLAEQDYNLSYLGGASTEFAGKGKFYMTHGFSEVLGREELIENIQDKSYQTGWGLFDDTLFDAGMEKFIELSKKSQPFGLFLLTLDTHHPNGHPSRSCEGKEYLNGDNPILNAVACSDYLIGKFISRILASDYRNNTVIVVSSDHLAMRNTATNMLDKIDRRNLFIVLSPDQNRPLRIDKTGSMLDVAPTVLDIMGYQAETGLGRNLLEEQKPLITELEDFDSVLKGWHEPLMAFWGFPKVSNDSVVKIEKNDNAVILQKRSFEYPLLIEFGENNETIIRFKLQRKKVKLTSQRLVDYVAHMDKNKAFLWVDSCKDIRPASANLWNDDCVLYGQAGTGNLKFSILDECATISVSNIVDPDAETEPLGGLKTFDCMSRSTVVNLSNKM